MLFPNTTYTIMSRLTACLFMAVFYSLICEVSCQTSGDSTRALFGRRFIFSPFVKWTITSDPHIQINFIAYSNNTGSCDFDYKAIFDYQKADTISLNESVTVISTNELLNPTSANSVVHVSCNEDVALNVIVEYNPHVPDSRITYSLSILPFNALSTEYMVPAINFRYSFLAVVSRIIQPYIQIKLPPKCTFYRYSGLSYKAGDIISLRLANSLQLEESETCFLGGAVVKSSTPVAVFTGSMTPIAHDSIKTSGSRIPPMVVQVPPISSFGYFFIIPESHPDSERSHVRLLASQDQTSIQVQAEYYGTMNTQSLTLDKALFEDLQFNVGVTVIVRSVKPILVSQFTEFRHYNTSFLVYPDVRTYDTTLMTIDRKMFKFIEYTCISPSHSRGSVKVNSLFLYEWRELPGTGYSVSKSYSPIRLSDSQTTLIEADEPVLVRLDYSNGSFSLQYESTSFISGYKISTEPLSALLSTGMSTTARPTDSGSTVQTGSGSTVQTGFVTPGQTGSGTVMKMINLECLPGGWLVVVDLNKLSSLDQSSIYLGQTHCTGQLEGSLLTFNVSYGICGTVFKVEGDQIMFENTIIGVNNNGGTELSQPLQCMKSKHEVNFVNLDGAKPKVSHVISSTIQGNLFSIQLFADRSFHNPVQDATLLSTGSDVFVMVTSAAEEGILVVNECDLILGNHQRKSGSVALIQKGCAVANGSLLLATRNEMTLFKFVMFDLGSNPHSASVSCDVTFCDPLDFSPECEQRCLKSPVLIG